MDPLDLMLEGSRLGARHNAPDNDASNYGFQVYLDTDPNMSGTNQAPWHGNLEKECNSRSWSSCGRHVDNDQLYCPLQEGEIRVLDILPAMKGVVKSRLYCIKLGDLDYSALSYAWGDLAKPKVSLFVNEHQLEVTENCLFALKELRRESTAQSKTCTIWIDAICS